jgi:hypothetical protein
MVYLNGPAIARLTDKWAIRICAQPAPAHAARPSACAEFQHMFETRRRRPDAGAVRARRRHLAKTDRGIRGRVVSRLRERYPSPNQSALAVASSISLQLFLRRLPLVLLSNAGDDSHTLTGLFVPGS